MKNITLFDGPSGLTLWAKAEERGIAKAPVWVYNIETPDMVAELNREYMEAGSRMILANTFSANGPAVKAASSYTTPQIVKAAFAITRKAAADYMEETGESIKVGMAVGPVTAMLEPFGDLSEEECTAIYEEMIGSGKDAGADFFYLQTFMDLEMMKIVAKIAVSTGLPVLASMTFKASGKTLFGNSPEDVANALTPLGVTALGLNCELGPDQMLPIVKEYAKVTDLPLVIKANAGVPVSKGGTGIGCDPVSYAQAMKDILPYVSFVGGCCGCDPEFIKEIGKLI